MTNISLTRRGFLGQGVSTVMAVGLLARSAETFAEDDSALPPLDAAAQAIPIFDTHIHLWDLDRFRLPWLDNASTLKRSFLPADYQAAVAGLNLAAGLYMEVDVAADQQDGEVDYVIDECRKRTIPLVGGIVSGRPASPTFDRWVDKLQALPRIRGVRQVLHGGSTPVGYCLQDAFVAGIRRLGEAGLTYDLCMRSAELSDGAKLVDRCPKTQFILDHCGNASVQSPDLTTWKADMVELAKRPNIAVKVSGVVATVKSSPWTPEILKPIVVHTLDAFGPDRVVFGGDWPVCTLGAPLRQWILALHAIVRDRSLEDRRKLFHNNATRIYRTMT